MPKPVGNTPQPSSALKFSRYKAKVQAAPKQPPNPNHRTPRDNEKMGFNADITSKSSAESFENGKPDFTMIFGDMPEGKEIYKVQNTRKIVPEDKLPPDFPREGSFKVSAMQQQDPKLVDLFVNLKDPVNVPSPKPLASSSVAKTSLRPNPAVDRFDCAVDILTLDKGFASLGWKARIEGPPLKANQEAKHREFSHISIEIPRNNLDKMGLLGLMFMGDARDKDSFAIWKTGNLELGTSGKQGYMVWPQNDKNDPLPFHFCISNLKEMESGKSMEPHIDSLPSVDYNKAYCDTAYSSYLRTLATLSTAKYNSGSLVEGTPQSAASLKQQVKKAIPPAGEDAGGLSAWAASTTPADTPTRTAIKKAYSGKSAIPNTSPPKTSTQPSAPIEPKPSGWTLLDVKPHYEQAISEASGLTLKAFKGGLEKGCHHKSVADYIQGCDHKKLQERGAWELYQIRLDGDERLTFVADKSKKYIWLYDIGGHT